MDFSQPNIIFFNKLGLSRYAEKINSTFSFDWIPDLIFDRVVFQKKFSKIGQNLKNWTFSKALIFVIKNLGETTCPIKIHKRFPCISDLFFTIILNPYSLLHFSQKRPWQFWN